MVDEFVAARITQEVDRLFEANRGRDLATIPIVGGSYSPRWDNIRRLKKDACAALLAREWFRTNGPADAQPLPVSYAEREDLKVGGLSTIVALYARSLDCRKFDVKEHPSFFDYACGFMASEFVGGYSHMQEDQQLRKRFPPRVLPGLGPGLCWEPPKEHARTMASYRRSMARIASSSASRDDPSKTAARPG